jgi:paraquat-inducible protein A
MTDSEIGTLVPAQLIECRDCGLIQEMPAVAPNTRVMCPRCRATLRFARRDPIALPLALNLTGMILFTIGASMTLMSLTSAGQRATATLISGPAGLRDYGLAALAIVVALTTIAIPLVRVVGMIAVCLALRAASPPAWTKGVYAIVEHLRPWSMIEIYLLGVFVAYVKLLDLATINIGPALYALAALTVAMVAADVVVDDHAIWHAIDRGGRLDRARARSAGALGRQLALIGCHTCGLVSRGVDGAHCPRCGFRLRHRKRDAVTRAWALLIASVILYIPANIYPVLVVSQIGGARPSTILGGVRELIEAGMWPLALLVFFASIVVPVLKMIGLATLLVSVRLGSRQALRERASLYRIIDFVGRWSMIDVFVISILVALMQFGTLSSVGPGHGATAFAAVVILTMFAAEVFDPRLMWDAAQGAAHE